MDYRKAIIVTVMLSRQAKHRQNLGLYQVIQEYLLGLVIYQSDVHSRAD